jgi:hypothetical protein
MCIRIGLLDDLELDGYTRDPRGARDSLFGGFGMNAALGIDLINERLGERNKPSARDTEIWCRHEDRKMGPLARAEGNGIVFGGTVFFHGRWGQFTET